MRRFTISFIAAFAVASTLFSSEPTTYSATATTFAGTAASLEAIRAANTRIYTQGIATYDANGVRNDATGTTGTDGSSNTMMTSSSLRGNFEFDHFAISIIVQSLITRQILPQPDSTIPSNMMPRGVTLISPSYTNTPMTLRQLMTHTTGLKTNSRFDPSPTTSGNNNAVTDLVTYCDVFVTASGSGYVQATDIWENSPALRPGVSTSYKPSRANTILLAYIVQQVITTRPTLVASSQKTVGALVQEFIINGMGLSSTYFLLPTGAVPKVQLGLDSFSGSKIAEHTSGGQIATTIPINAAIIGSGVMFITSAADIGKMMQMLFIEASGVYTALGVSLVDSLKPVLEADTAITSTYGITHLGFGINRFDAARLCAMADQTLPVPVSTGCVALASPLVFGFSATGTNSATGGMCIDYTPYATLAVTVNAKRLCSGVTMAMNPIGGTLAAAATIIPAVVGAANEVFIDPLLTDGTTITVDDQQRKWDYGLLTFAYICAVMLGVFVVAYFSEYYVQPMPVVGHLSAGAYPTTEEHLAKSVARARRGM